MAENDALTRINMFKNLFKRKGTGHEFASPMARDVLRRLDGTPDDSATGRAIRDAEAAMREATTAIPNEVLNRNEATKATSTYFMTGVAVGYAVKHGVPQTDTNAIAAVVQCALRQWTSARAADYMAKCLGSYLTDEDWSGPVIDRAMEAVHMADDRASEVARVLNEVLEQWRTFDTDAYYKKQKQQAFG